MIHRRLPPSVVPALALATLLVAASGSPGVAAEGGGGPAAASNVRITLTIGDTDPRTGFAERTYRVVAREGSSTELMMGWRTPIPAKRREVTADGEAPTTTYTYQNVGVTATLSIGAIEGSRVPFEGVIEVSGVRDLATEAPTSDAPPTIGTFQQRVAVVLQDGKMVRIAEVPDPEGGSLYLEILAEIQP